MKERTCQVIWCEGIHIKPTQSGKWFSLTFEYYYPTFVIREGKVNIVFVCISRGIPMRIEGGYWIYWHVYCKINLGMVQSIKSKGVWSCYRARALWSSKSAMPHRALEAPLNWRHPGDSTLRDTLNLFFISTVKSVFMHLDHVFVYIHHWKLHSTFHRGAVSWKALQELCAA